MDNPSNDGKIIFVVRTVDGNEGLHAYDVSFDALDTNEEFQNAIKNMRLPINSEGKRILFQYPWVHYNVDNIISVRIEMEMEGIEAPTYAAIVRRVAEINIDR